jgi:ferritin-like metal-binding protein YciE
VFGKIGKRARGETCEALIGIAEEGEKIRDSNSTLVRTQRRATGLPLAPEKIAI